MERIEVDLNLFYRGAVRNFAKAHFFEVGDFGKLLREVYNTVSVEYGSLATIRINTPDIYELDGTTIPEGIALPEPKSGNPSIDIFFEQNKEITPDSATLVDQIDKLFDGRGHYKPIEEKPKKGNA